MVFELQQGMIDRGAELQWLSQYPWEEEILFAPLSALEVRSTYVEGSVLVIVVRLNCNLNALTIEQVVARMQRSHLQLIEDVITDMKHAGCPGTALQPLQLLAVEMASFDPVWFNSPPNYRAATNQALDALSETVERLGCAETWASRLEPAALHHGDVKSTTVRSLRSTAAVSEGLEKRIVSPAHLPPSPPPSLHPSARTQRNAARTQRNARTKITRRTRALFHRCASVWASMLLLPNFSRCCCRASA